MPLDVLKLGRVAKGGIVPVQLPEPLVQRWVSGPDVAQVALEVLHVHDVEADDGRVQSDVGLRDVLAEVVWTCGRGQVFLDPVERVEELRDGFLVSGLRSAGRLVRVTQGSLEGRGRRRRAASLRRKTRLVHAVVDIVIHPPVRTFDVLLQILGEQIHLSILLRQYVVELGIEHADDLAAFVVDDLALLLVVERRHREAPLVFRVRFEVDLLQRLEVGVHRVWRHILAGEFLVRRYEAPSFANCQERLLSNIVGRSDGEGGPCSSMCQCTEVKGMNSSSPLSFRTISVRCAVRFPSVCELFVDSSGPN